jgi:general secretion pathway protein K
MNTEKRRFLYKACHPSPVTPHLLNEKGMVLVLTLMILVLITAMVVEFAYGVYTSTSALHNWKEAQKLSFVSKSGVSVAVKTISELKKRNLLDELYKYLGLKIPAENMMEGFSGSLIISAEDENGKFNLNSINKVWRDGSRRANDSFKRLLRRLDLHEGIADKVAYWIDKNSVPRLLNSEEVTKNAYMESVDELLLIKGIDSRTYQALFPYVTVYGYDGSDDVRVNMNTAPVPVIMSLSDGISGELAEQIVNYRKLQPFKQPGDLDNTGLNSMLRNPISDMFTVYPPVNFRITSVSEENGIKRVIETVVKTGGSILAVYWREM